MRRIWVLWGVLMLVLLPIQRMEAQSALRMQNYSHELSEHMVTDIRQDERGFLWFSTWNGLHRFDGYTFKNYKTYPGEECVMESNRVLMFRINQSGNIWCLDYDRNIYLFNPHTERFYAFATTLENRFGKSSTFSNIICTPDRLSYLISSRAIYRVDEQTFDPRTGEGIVYQTFEELGIDRVVDVVCPPGAKSWMVCDRRLVAADQTVAIPEGITLCAAIVSGEKIWLASKEGHLGSFTPSTGLLAWEQLPIDQASINFLQRLDDDLLAIGTNRGLLLYSIHAHRYSHYDPARSGIGSSNVTDCYRDSKNNLWLFTERDGVVRCDLASGTMQFLQTPKEDIPGSSVSSTILCFEDHLGTLWVVPRGGGFCWWDASSQQLRTYQADPARPETKFTPITSLHFLDRQGNLWYSGSSGLFRISFLSENVYYRQLDAGFETRGMKTDLKGRLWVATKRGMLRIYNPDGTFYGYLAPNGKIQSKPIPHPDNIYCFLEDHNGDVWMGTRLHGLCRLTPNGKDSYRLTRYRHREDDPFSLSGDSVFDLFQDSHRRIWVCTYGGGINLIQPAEDGTVRFLHSRNCFKDYPIDHCYNTRTIVEKQGVLLVGTTNGLITFDGNFTDPATIHFYQNGLRPNDSSCLPTNDVHDIFTDSRGESYVMSFTGGISRILSGDLLSENIRFRNYNIKDGLSSELAHTMVEDKAGMLWIVFENAIDRFNPNTGEIDSYGEPLRYYTEARPIFHGDELVVATIDGLAYIRTQSLYKSDYTPPIAFSTLRLQGSGQERIIDHLDKITLTPKERDIQIQFAALDYANPTNIEYHYRMQGLETEWNRVIGHHTASYTDLRPGKYRFEVYSTNSDGVKVDNLRSMEVVVTPRFRETSWAMLLIVLAVMALILLALSVYLHIYRLRSRIGIEQQLTDIKLRFFTDVSHELRTPLTLIASPVDEVLEHESLSDKARNHLGIVQQNTQRMLRLINQILDFRKIENGKMKLLVEQVELLPLLQHITENFHLIAERNRNDYTIQLPEQGLLGWMDRDKVEKICVNLLSNAFKYTPEGRGIHFHVSADTQQLTIIVSDEGVGMDQKVKERLFRRFENILGATNFPSSGIGLSLIKELIDLMEGTIEVESTPGVGSCFTVQLPTSRAHYARLPHAELVISEPATDSVGDTDGLPIPPDDNEKKTLLVIEDNQELRTVLNDILSSEYRVVTATNGAEGLELARTESPDLILTDVMMPVMDGLEMTRHIKEDRNLCHLPIIVLSAKSSLDDRISGLEQGIDDYITKPFVGSYLKARIRNLLSHYRTMRERFLSQLTAPNSRLEEISPAQPHLLSQDEEFMKHLMAVIEKHMDNTEITIEEFARELNMAHSTFYNKIKALLGITPVEFIREMRLKRAHQLLTSEAYDVSSVSYMVGFSDPRYFSKCFKKRFGILPSQVRAAK